MRNQAKLPRTVGLRTISELSSELTKAGYNPSRIEERAALLAKVAGAKRKREREEDEAQMEVDGEEEDEEEEAEWMDVDGEDHPTPNKRAKVNSGAVVTKGKREPRSDRRLAGMRDSTVRSSGHFLGDTMLMTFVWRIASSKSYQAAGPGPEETEYAREGWRVRSCDQDQDGMSSTKIIEQDGC